MTSPVTAAREAFARREWGDAYRLFAEAGTLDAEDLERLAVAACLIGRDAESVRAWEQAHLEFARIGDPDRAAQCVFWLAMGLLLQRRPRPGQRMAGATPRGCWTSRDQNVRPADT